MRWYSCYLYENTYGKDALNNPIKTGRTLTKQTIARQSPHDITLAETADRDITQDTQTFIIPIVYEKLPAFDTAEIDGKEYEITRKESLQRFTVLECRRFRTKDAPQPVNE